MVAVDNSRKFVAVKLLQPDSGDERRRDAAGLLRKEMRQEMEKRFRDFRAGGCAVGCLIALAITCDYQMRLQIWPRSNGKS